MAKGNNGNYLQHSVELAIAVHLAGLDSEGRLHIMLTHGMAPSEPCGEVPRGQAKKYLHTALSLAQAKAKQAEPTVVTAYRATKASLDAYPNSGELIAAVIGRSKLSGGITEVDPAIHADLHRVWKKSGVNAVLASWRKEMSDAGVHGTSSLSREGVPWLLSMDPMTYSDSGFADDNKIYRHDREQISRTLRTLAASKVPGAASIFVYAVRPNDRSKFWDFAKCISSDTGMSLTTCWLTHQGGNQNLAAIFCTGMTLPNNWLPPHLNVDP
jgi:hypothetical protein